MIRQIRDPRPVRLDPVANRRSRVDDPGGGDGERLDAPRHWRDVVKLDTRGEIPDSDGKEWRRQVFRQPRPHVLGRRWRAPDVHFPARFEQWSEEAEALDVIHVQVGQEHVDRPAVARKRCPSTAHPGAGVEDEDAPFSSVDLDAGGVAAVTDRLRTCARERATRAPDGDPHSGWTMVPCHITTIVPRTCPPALSSGIAVASTFRRTPSRPWM